MEDKRVANGLYLILDDIFLSLFVRSSESLPSRNGININIRVSSRARSSQRRTRRCIGGSIRVENHISKPSFRWRCVHEGRNGKAGFKTPLTTCHNASPNLCQIALTRSTSPRRYRDTARTQYRSRQQLDTQGGQSLRRTWSSARVN
jgi:hypothetical protein